MIGKRLQRDLPITTRVALGFGSVLALLVVIAAHSYSGITSTLSGMARFEVAAENARGAVEIEREVAELRNMVHQYAQTGITSLAISSRRTSASLERDLQSLQVRVEDPERLELLHSMQRHLASYVETFEKVISEREIRDKLVDRDLEHEAMKTHDAFRRLISSSNGHRLPFAAKASFLEARGAIYEYFDQPSSSQVVRFQELLHDSLGELARYEQDSAETAELVDSLKAFERHFLRAVQSTRGYMALRQVVMAGEAAEFRYQAELLREAFLADEERIKIDTELAAETRRQTIAMVTLLALLVGVIASAVTGKGIVLPVQAVAQTFRQLAAGHKELRIPGLDRGDEIGAMAQAADVFQQRNEETEDLLRQSRQLSTELELKQVQLEEANAEMETFVYTVSHDLKSPLVTSMGYVGMIQELADAGEVEQAVAKVQKLEGPNRRMNQLITDLLTLSRLGRVETESTVIDVRSVVEDLIEGMRGRYDGESLELFVESSTPPLFAQQGSVLQALDNLIGNAVKYSRPQGTPRVVIGGHEVDGELRYFVRDNGPGVPPEHQDQIFGLFQRSNTDAEGTGIGLAIVRRTMANHGGRTWVESHPGVGATFWIAFPADTCRAPRENSLAA